MNTDDFAEFQDWAEEQVERWQLEGWVETNIVRELEAAYQRMVVDKQTVATENASLTIPA